VSPTNPPRRAGPVGAHEHSAGPVGAHEHSAGPVGAHEHGADLGRRTLTWSLDFLDRARHLVWNPSCYDGAVPARTVHLVPDSAWIAYGLLARRAPGDLDEACAILTALLELQYDAPGEPFDGTFAAFAESPRPPDGDAVVWRDYDPNWRQFLGTTFVLVLEDFGGDLPAALAGALETAIGRAVHGEPDARIALDYTNPGLMHAFLLSWYGTRTGEVDLVERGDQRARALVERFDELGGFDEHNSPTYYGIDLLALALWHELGPTPGLRDAGLRIAEVLWRETIERYNPRLRNWCGPYTRSYGPDATRSVTLLGLWYAALLGGSDAPLPELVVAEGSHAPGARLDEGTPPEVHHSNDVMAGPVVARLARFLAPVAGSACATLGNPGSSGSRPAAGGVVQRDLGGRVLTSWITPALMIGAEASERDWPPTGQGVPVCVHWLEGFSDRGTHNGSGDRRGRRSGSGGGSDGEGGSGRRPDVGTLWMPGAHVVHARTHSGGVTLERPNAAPGEAVRLLLSGAVPVVDGSSTVHAGSLTVTATGDVSSIECRPVASVGAAADYEVLLRPAPNRSLSHATLQIAIRPDAVGA
jgi:uncharacterized membrane protein YgcG